MRKPSFEEAYNSLVRLGGGPMDEEAVVELRRTIAGPTSLLASMAVDIAARRGVYDLVPEMISAFDRFMVDGAKTDKSCTAKISVVNALNKLDFMGDAVFLTGASYIQMEAAYVPTPLGLGGKIDTAVQVRSGCAFGLARIEHPDAGLILTDMLVDNESIPRAAAAKALGYLGRPECVCLLRLKVLTGDVDTEVIRECFESLIAMSPAQSIDFVARYLRSNDLAIAQYSALAIASSREPRAYDKLREAWDENPSPSARRMLLLPIALTRTVEAFHFLLEVLRTADPKTAVQTVSALKVCTPAGEGHLVEKTVKTRKIAEVTQAYEAEFI